VEQKLVSPTVIMTFKLSLHETLLVPFDRVASFFQNKDTFCLKEKSFSCQKTTRKKAFLSIFGFSPYGFLFQR